MMFVAWAAGFIHELGRLRTSRCCLNRFHLLRRPRIRAVGLRTGRGNLILIIAIDTRSTPSALATRLRQCSTGRHPNLPCASIAVGAQCSGGTTHRPPATARPHHRNVGDTALATSPRTRAVQDRGANVERSARQRATISGTSCRRRCPT